MVLLKGIDPELEPQVTTLATKLTNKHLPFSQAIHDNMVLIGKKMAENKGLEEGDELTLLTADQDALGKKKIRLEEHHVTIGGIFNTGIDEFDNGVIYCSLEQLESMFPESGPTQIGVKLIKGSNEPKTIEALRNRLQLDVYSWKEFYPALVSALKLEKYAMFLIIALITLVASMNIISLLFMQITQKRGDIAILKAMGLPDGIITRIFMYMGLIISFCATVTGLGIAAMIGWLLETYPFISVPDAYYFTHLPSRMEPTIFVLVFVVEIFLTIISTLIPIRAIRRINIAQVLRYES